MMFNQLFGLVSAFFLLCSSSSAAGDVVRLVGTEGYCSGRVEVYHNYVWGTVCDDIWDIWDARVVCSQLGCGPASAVHSSAYFGQGTGNIWLDDVRCTGSESSLSECDHNGYGVNNCEHSEDAGVTCEFHQIQPFQGCSGYVYIYNAHTWTPVSYNGFDMNAAKVACRQMGCGPASHYSHYPYSFTTNFLHDISCSGTEFFLKQCQHSHSTYQYAHQASVSCSGYPIQLIGPSRCAGRVEIYYSPGWQTVCDDGWDLTDAQVVCSRLDCGLALAATHSAFFGRGADKILLDDVACTGSETHLSECPHRGYFVQNCSHSQDAGVICSAGLSRLIGPSRCSGRVEIYNNRSWGTVCNNSWDINDARVVCRQLGCGTAVSVLQFGEGAGDIYEVNCTGNERYLSECLNNGFAAQNCSHNKDAGVICSGTVRPSINLSPQGSITLGQSASITSSVPDGQVEGTFVFTKTTGSSTQTVISSSSSATFHIPRATFNDVGYYKCQFQIIFPNENFTTLFSDTVLLQVIFPGPNINIDPSGVITLDQNVRIICSVTEEQGGGSFLFKKSPETFNKTIYSNSSSATLFLPQVTFKDEGSYKCQFKVRVSNEDFSTSFSNNVQLYLKGALPKPYLILQPAGLVSWDQSVSIICVVTDGLTGTFYFKKLPDPLNQNVISSSNSATFHISHVRLSNEGLYQCLFQRTVLNEVFQSGFSDPVWLAVNLSEPTITLNLNGVVMWSQNVVLTCSVTEGKEGGLFIFRRMPGPFSLTVNSNQNSANFTITTVGLQDEGMYQCLFQRKVSDQDFNTSFSGPVQLSVVLLKPNITLDPANVIVIGHNVSFSCSVSEGQVGGSFIYRKTSGPITHVVNSSSSIATIQIPHVRFVDEGSYQCQFRRRGFNQDVGTNFSDSVQLTVKFPKPNISVQPTGVITWGQNVNITCSMTSKEGGASFIFTKIPGAFSQTVKSSSISAVLTLHQVSFADEGCYRCQFQTTAFSSILSDDVRLNLTVILPKPSIMDPVVKVTWGDLIAITCEISTQFLGGSFTLQKTSGSFNKTQPSTTNSSTFRFLEANNNHKGDYTCYYDKTLDNQTFTSPLSDIAKIYVVDS